MFVPPEPRSTFYYSALSGCIIRLLHMLVSSWVGPMEAMRVGVEARRVRLEHLFPQPRSIRSQVDSGHVSLPKPWLLSYVLSWRCIPVHVPPHFLLLWTWGRKWLLGLRLFTIPSWFSMSCPNFCNNPFILFSWINPFSHLFCIGLWLL